MTKDEYATVGRRADGSMKLGVWALHWLGKAVNIQFHVGGWPYGAAWKRASNRCAQDHSRNQLANEAGQGPV